jgi:hypothetical protein
MLSSLYSFYYNGDLAVIYLVWAGLMDSGKNAGKSLLEQRQSKLFKT